MKRSLAKCYYHFVQILVNLSFGAPGNVPPENVPLNKNPENVPPQKRPNSKCPSE